ncbi:MAG: hypothetical protein NVSMB2_02000 [Chloroflexota bacterium]
MSAYHEVLALAREQVAAISRNDLDTVIRLLDDRAAVLAQVPRSAHGADGAIAEILLLDRQIAAALRERMIAIRDHVLTLNRGAEALAGYRPEDVLVHVAIDSQC